MGLLRRAPLPPSRLAQLGLCWGLAGKAKGCSGEEPHSRPSRAWAAGKACTSAGPREWGSLGQTPSLAVCTVVRRQVLTRRHEDN